MRNYHRLIRQLLWRLPADKRAKYLLEQIDARGELRDVDVDRLAAYMPQDGADRSTYLRCLWQWSRAHGDILGLAEEDTLDQAAKELLIRTHITSRFSDHQRPQVEALEFYDDEGGYRMARQGAYTPSGIERVSAVPEEAWQDFVLWAEEQGYKIPPLRQSTYVEIFCGPTRPFHNWELRETPDTSVMKPCPWCGEKCASPKPLPPSPEKTPSDSP